MYKYMLLVLGLFSGLVILRAQKSQVTDDENQGLAFSKIMVLGSDSQKSILSDSLGYFSLSEADLNKQIVIDAFGYELDTFKVATLTAKYKLSSVTDLETLTVSKKKKGSSIMFAKTIQTENITEKELYKAACCNLAESFETNPAVDASFNDGATGTKTIKLLGLGGKYALLSVENMPRIRGNNLYNGLAAIPGSWVESIQILKGNSSVSNGFEGMSGQINTQLKGLDHTKSIQEINSYVNSLGRYELNGINQIVHTEKVKSAILWNHSSWANKIDQNNDGFYEMPESNQQNLLLRTKFSPSNKIHNQINLSYNRSEKNGGSDLYNFNLNLNEQNYGFFGKSGVVLNDPGKSIGFQYSFNQYAFDGKIGDKSIDSKSKEIYLNLMHQSYINNTNHGIKIGASYLKENLDDQVIYESNDSSYYRFNRTVFGAFVEYNGHLSENDQLTLGLRTDVYGNDIYFLPRLNYKHSFNNNLVYRLGAGRAIKSNYFLAENYGSMINNRRVYGLSNLVDPEDSYSIFNSLWYKFKIGYREASFLIEHHYQDFNNRYLAHYQDNALIIKQHKEATNQSFLVQLDYEILPGFDLKMAYKYNEQKAEDLGLSQNNLWLLPKNRSFINLSYETRNKWLFNATLNRIGRQFLPPVNLSDIPVSNEITAFYKLGAQISKTHKRWRAYLGVENALNVRQENVWFGIDSGNPEASISYLPPIGTAIHFGINYKFFE